MAEEIFEVTLNRYRDGAPALEERLTGDAFAVAEWCRAIASELHPGEAPATAEGNPECVLLHPHRGPCRLGASVSTREHHHHLVQHRDGRPPWCPSCRRTAQGAIVPREANDARYKR